MTEQTEKPKIFVLDRYTLFAGVENNQRASMEFGLREGYPRITVWTRSESDNNGKGFLSAPFDLDHFLMFLTRLEFVARQKEPTKEQALVKHWPRDPEGKIKGDKEVSCEVWFGKDEDGTVWISLVQPNRPKIKFEIVMSDFHEFRTKDGVMSKGMASMLRTIVMCGVLREWFTTHSLSFRDTSIPRPSKGNYSSRKQGGGYSGAKATADAGALDDDVMF